MNKYKFRGKSLETGEWVYGYGIIHNPENDIYQIIHRQGRNLTQHTQVKPETIGQFTGLKDEKGVEIYEMDIVFMGFPFTKANAEIIFDNGQFYPNSKCETIYTRYWAKNCMVIGNTIDNPELGGEK